MRICKYFACEFFKEKEKKKKNKEEWIEPSTLFENHQQVIRKPAYFRPQPEGIEQASQLVSFRLPYFSLLYSFFSLHLFT